MLHAAVLSELRPDLVWQYAPRRRPVQDLVKVTFFNQMTFTDGHIFVPFLPKFSRFKEFQIENCRTNDKACLFQRTQSGPHPGGGSSLQLQRVRSGLQLQTWFQNEPKRQVLRVVKSLFACPTSRPCRPKTDCKPHVRGVRGGDHHLVGQDFCRDVSWAADAASPKERPTSVHRLGLRCSLFYK